MIHELVKIQQQLNHALQPIVHHAKMNHLDVVQTRKHRLMGETVKVVAWNHHTVAAPIITIQHVVQILKDANVNMHRMDVVQIIELPPEDMKMLVAVVNTRNTAVAQVKYIFLFSINFIILYC